MIKIHSRNSSRVNDSDFFFLDVKLFTVPAVSETGTLSWGMHPKGTRDHGVGITRIFMRPGSECENDTHCSSPLTLQLAMWGAILMAGNWLLIRRLLSVWQIKTSLYSMKGIQIQCDAQVDNSEVGINWLNDCHCESWCQLLCDSNHALGCSKDI